MMPTDRFERRLPALLTEIANPRTPDYLDDLLWQTAHTSQRPAWSFLERWLPVLDVARQPVIGPPIPWRSIGLGFVLLALLVAMVAALVIGSQKAVPAPFGPARNGLVAYADNGDIYTADPTTGTSTPVATGPEVDLNPVWSRDGTHIAFERKPDPTSAEGSVYVAKADGTGLVQLTPEPVAVIADYEFSPDGTQLLINAGPSSDPYALVAATDGSKITELNLGLPTTQAAWRPPDGAQILFMERGDFVSGKGGLYVHDLAKGQTQAIFEKASGRYRDGALWSPDGSLVAYGEWVDGRTITVQTHIIGADGTGERVLPIPPDAVWQMPHAWSNDGSRLLVVRGYTGAFVELAAAVVPADGSGYGVENPSVIQGECCSVWEWAPDDSVILGTGVDSSTLRLNQVLLDPVTGTTRSVPWTSTSPPTWQRLAP